MFNCCKYIFLKIIIAQKKNKKLICIKYRKRYVLFFNLLWKEGYIYGYYISFELLQYILIKFSKREVFTYKRFYVSKNIISNKKFIKLSSLEKNSNFFLINDTGILNKSCVIHKGLGGILIIKI